MVVRFVCVIRVSVRPVCAVCPGSPRSLFTGTRPVQSVPVGFGNVVPTNQGRGRASSPCT